MTPKEAAYKMVKGLPIKPTRFDLWLGVSSACWWVAAGATDKTGLRPIDRQKSRVFTTQGDAFECFNEAKRLAKAIQ